MLDKYNGPDLYSSIGIIAAELNELPDVVQSKIDSKKAAVEAELEKFKQNTKTELEQVRIEYTSAFSKMKDDFTTSIRNLRSQIDQVQSGHSSTTSFSSRSKDTGFNLSAVNKKIDEWFALFNSQTSLDVDRIVDQVEQK